MVFEEFNVPEQIPGVSRGKAVLYDLLIKQTASSSRESSVQLHRGHGLRQPRVAVLPACFVAGEF